MSEIADWLNSKSVVLFLLTLAFQSGGFIWLAKNHMRHAQESLDRLDRRMNNVEQRLARICGHLGLDTWRG